MVRLLAFGLLLLCSQSITAQVSPLCESLRKEMTRSAYRVHGPSAPVALLAAQTEQESACRSGAVSKANAKGLNQFIDATAADMARLHPADCAPANPFDPRWSITCRDRYMKSLVASIRGINGTVDLCSSWMFGLQRFNGGYWIEWDRTAAYRAGADPNAWALIRFHQGVNPRTGRMRTLANHHENHEYPVRILRRQTKYISAGWGSGVCN